MITHGDSLQEVKKMDDKSVDCVITSPPYWQLRNYGFEEQWGLEPTYQEYLEHLWSLMDEIWRVLKDTGTVWINLGDSYNTKSGNMTQKEYQDTINVSMNNSVISKDVYTKAKDIPSKCLLLIPHRFAIGCIDRGWILRNDVVWAKRNGMPESVTDRFSKKHEYFFFMVKKPKGYYFDLDGVREKLDPATVERYKRGWEGNGERDYVGGPQNHFKSWFADKDKKQASIDAGKNPGDVSDFWDKSKYDNKQNESTHRQGMNKLRGSGIIEKRPYLPRQDVFVASLRENFTVDEIVEKTGIQRTKAEHWFRTDESGFAYPSKEDWEKLNTDLWVYELTTIIYETDGIEKNKGNGKNPGDVSDFWDVPTQPSSAKHYATFNTDLIDKPIIAGCPKEGVILDPFCGTGTTLIRGLQLNRQVIGIDGKKEYCDIARERIKQELSQLKLAI